MLLLPSPQNEIRCSVCRQEFSREQKGLQNCPFCNTTVMPHLIAHDVVLKINWGDLRVLMQWAIRHAYDHKFPPDVLNFLDTISKEIKKVRPVGSAPLTQLEELEMIRKQRPQEDVFSNLPEDPLVNNKELMRKLGL